MEAVHERVGALRRSHPLPAEAGEPEVFTDEIVVGSWRSRVVGLAVDFRGECITGSAGEPGAAPVERAYFELLERLSVVWAMECPSARFTVRDDAALEVGAEVRDQVFPEMPPGFTCKWSRSNGVALGADWQGAARRARLELLERDAVLRSWYGATSPTRLDASRVVPTGLEDLYEFECHEFECGEARVAGAFAFPRAGGPFVHGFGAAASLDEACSGAMRECLQRLSFLWGEELPPSPPDFSSTPDFHQAYYLSPDGVARITAWLRGGHVRFRGVLDATAASSASRAVDLTPSWLRGLRVARALPAGHVPLCFGRGHPLLRATPDALLVHPIA